MRFGSRLDVMRYEVCVLSPWLFAIPVALAIFFAALAWMFFVGHVDHGFIAQVLVAGIEACLPLAVGILLASVAAQDAALELQLSMPVAYRFTAFRRFLLILGWTLVVELVATLVLQMLLPWVLPKALLEGQLTWLAPSLCFAGVGTLLALVMRSRSTSGAILGCIWVIELTFHGYFAQSSWLQPWFLFSTIYTPHASFWLTNRVELVLTGVVTLIAAWCYLHNNEWRFFGEES